MLVASSDKHHFLFFQAQVSHVDVGRHIDAGEVTDVHASVCVGQCCGDGRPLKVFLLHVYLDFCCKDSANREQYKIKYRRFLFLLPRCRLSSPCEKCANREQYKIKHRRFLFLLPRCRLSSPWAKSANREQYKIKHRRFFMNNILMDMIYHERIAFFSENVYICNL